MQASTYDYDVVINLKPGLNATSVMTAIKGVSEAQLDVRISSSSP